MIGKKRLLVGGLLVVFIFVFSFKVMKATGWEKNEIPLSRIAREIVAPIQRGISVLTRGTTEFFAYFSDNEVLREENKLLEEEIALLKEQVFTLKEQELENIRLKNLLNYQEEKSANYDLMMAKVIGRDPSNSYKTIILDKGSKHGLKPNMTVVNHDGLIGRILSVTNKTAEVLLILDSESGVGGRIFENRVTPGVVVGTGRTEYLQMIHLSHDILIEEGQTVVTSGLGGLFPKGIRVGTIFKVEFEANGLMKTALVKPFVSFSTLEEVFVVLETKNPEAAMKEELLPEESGEGSGL